LHYSIQEDNFGIGSKKKNKKESKKGESVNNPKPELSSTPITLPTPPIQIQSPGPIMTSTKQIAGYFTVGGIENEISIPEKDWPCFALKELMDNAYDWLNAYYPSTDISSSSLSRRRQIAVQIRIDIIPKDPYLTRVCRITVRNSNVDQIEAFHGNIEGLKQIFDYNQWTSTKRHQHRMTVGALGDYLKRHGGMAYASWNNIARDDTITNEAGEGDEEEEDSDNLQWEEPLIFRFNGSEYKVYVYYDRYRGIPESIIKYAGQSDAIDYTEVECSLPVSRENYNGSKSEGEEDDTLFNRLYEYYSMYKIPKADIKFSFDMKYGIRHIREEDGEGKEYE
jgi:hypothetical protein